MSMIKKGVSARGGIALANNGSEICKCPNCGKYASSRASNGKCPNCGALIGGPRK